MSPLRGFYVIITDEYALRGTVPQAVYLDQMMQHLERKYYVALLNAAEYHGAAHQAPMSFCVMIVSVAKLEGFVLAGGGSGRDGSGADKTGIKGNFCFDGRISSGIEDLATGN